MGTDALPEPIASAVHAPSEGNIAWEFPITSHCTSEQLAKGFLLVLKEIPEVAGSYYDYPIIYTSESPEVDELGPRLVIDYIEE